MAEHGNSDSRPNCFVCPHHQQTEWSALREAQIQRINKVKVCRNYQPAEVVFFEGDPCRGVYCIENGLVGIRKAGIDGESVLLKLAHTGDILGYRPFLSQEPHRASAEVLKPTSICFVPGAVVRDMLDESPALGFQFLNRAAKAQGAAEEKFHQTVTMSGRDRLFHLLLVMKDRYAMVTEDNALVLELPISHKDMAAMIGVRPESLSRIIRKLEEEGVMTFSGRKVRVFSADSLLRDFYPEACR